MAGQGEFSDDPERIILRDRGYEFCDDRNEPVPRPSKEQGALLRESVVCLENLIAEGLVASSTDHDTQSIDQTLTDEMDFWSSVGSTFRDATESLMYRLKYPVCLVHAVQVSVYRATYQFGRPIYPPGSASIDVGPSPEKLHRVSEAVPIYPHTEPQIISLSRPTVAIGGYLRVWMEGKPQRQLADGRHYVAIRYVSAYGLPIPDSVIWGIPRALRCMDVALFPSGSRFPSAGLASVTPSTKLTTPQTIQHRCKNYWALRDAGSSAVEGSRGQDRNRRRNALPGRAGLHRGPPRGPYGSVFFWKMLGVCPPDLNLPETAFQEADSVDWPVFEFPEQMCNSDVETDDRMPDES